MFTAAVARRTKFAPTAAPGPATTLRSIRNAAKSASKAATVPRARRWTHLACAFPSTNVRASTKESNISRAIKNSDRERVRQTSGTQDSLFPPPVAIYNPYYFNSCIICQMFFSDCLCRRSTCISARWHCQPATLEERDLLANVTLRTQMECRSSHNEEYTPCEPEHQLTCKVYTYYADIYWIHKVLNYLSEYLRVPT